MATMEALLKLMPSADDVKGLLGWEPILAWVKLDATIWAKVAAAMGEEGISDTPMIAAGEDEDYTAAMVKAELGSFQRARVNLAVNIARAKEGLPLSLIASKPPPGEGGCSGRRWQSGYGGRDCSGSGRGGSRSGTAPGQRKWRNAPHAEGQGDL